ncbi:glycosyltransferase [Granulicella sp. dw_53]|uniref:glycosyltransferase family 8 protein n=1 Tax=Granulicella sp. dw_53 TaxID=2719792 RepID=UPI001BD5F0FA|nr:glycosyltransferase [Granulicella sp. dw_53]
MALKETRVTTIAVALCSDLLMEVPLHVALASLLAHLSSTVEPHFYLLLTGFSDHARDDLRRTLDVQERAYKLTFLSDEAAGMFRDFPSLHGSHTAYNRILLPDLIDEPRVLYIDVDTISTVDIAPLFIQDMDDCVTGFVIDGTVASSLERSFFLRLGRGLDSPMFNSGVMLFNPAGWHQLDYSQQVKVFMGKYGAQLLSHDQTILNALFADNCFHLNRSFNIKVYPKRGSSMSKGQGIYHFLGSPKPWDMGGKTLFPHAKPWFDALEKTALPFSKKTLWLNSSYWKRVPRLLGSYRRVIQSVLSPAA